MTMLHIHVPGDTDRYTDECIAGLVGQDRITVSIDYRHDLDAVVARATVIAAGPADDHGLNLTIRLDQHHPTRLAAMLAASTAHRRRFGMGFQAERATLRGDAVHDGREYQAIRLRQLAPEPMAALG